MSTVTGSPVLHEHGDRPIGVSPTKAARLLDCTREHIYRLLARGELDSFKVGASRKVTTDSIERLAGKR